jgi:transcriptional regulator with XRE-family HTH domain
MVNEQALLADLVDAINAWLSGNKSRSLSGLARRTNVAYSTIRRIAQNESVPHPYTALSIAEIVMTVPQRVEFLKKHFPTIGNLMEECYSGAIRRDPNEESLRRFLRLEPHNRIFNIAATRAGTNRKALLQLAGQMGIDAVEEMLDAGLLIETPDGTIKYTHDSWALGNVDDALDQVRHSTEHFNKNLVGTDGASLMHATGAISKEMVPRLKELVLKFIKDLNALKDLPEAEGGIHFFCDMMYSLYDRHEWDTRTEQLE